MKNILFLTILLSATVLLSSCENSQNANENNEFDGCYIENQLIGGLEFSRCAVDAEKDHSELGFGFFSRSKADNFCSEGYHLISKEDLKIVKEEHIASELGMRHTFIPYVNRFGEISKKIVGFDENQPNIMPISFWVEIDGKIDYRIYNIEYQNGIPKSSWQAGTYSIEQFERDILNGGEILLPVLCVRDTVSEEILKREEERRLNQPEESSDDPSMGYGLPLTP